MLSVSNVSLQYGGRVLFKDVNASFQPQNCYGIIGANGAGKSTFLKILSGEIEPNTGEVTMSDKERMSVLKQDQNAYDNETVIDTVLLGHPRLMEVQREKDALYAKPDFSEEDGILAGELELEYAELDGYEADANARQLLNSLGITGDLQDKYMHELDSKQKVKVLLAQALFGDPDILLLDEPTNHLDMESITSVNNGLIKFPGVVLFTSQDHQFIQTIANRIIELTPNGMIDKVTTYDEYLDSDDMARKRQALN